jgi:hypothetical protein
MANERPAAYDLPQRANPPRPPYREATLREMPGPTGRALTTEAFSAVTGPAPVQVADIPDEEGGYNGDRPLSVPGSEGTGPVDPAIDFVRNDRV